MRRVLTYLLDKVNNKVRVPRRPTSFDSLEDWRYGCPDVVRELRSRPIWGDEEAPWKSLLEMRFADIKAEFVAAQHYEGPLFQPYRYCTVLFFTLSYCGVPDT
jgi:hypothetical protein